MKKTGEVYVKDEDGIVWLHTSYEDENGQVSTQSVQVDGDTPALMEKPFVVPVMLAPKKPWWKRIF